ncbi:MAG: hypothetical protein H8E98_07740 [Bacteroidetes bacterium]|nr:hypothetical protein [Bacteroidota bacterium]
MNKLILFVIIIFILSIVGCEDETVPTDHDLIQGNWVSNFEVTYPPEMDLGSVTIVEYEATLGFQEDSFTINVAPPVMQNPMIWWSEYRSQWFGNYSLNGDTIFFNVTDSSEIRSPYIFKLHNDSLYMAIVYESDESGIMLVTLGGGLPWGHAQRMHFGWFYKSTE